MEAWTPGLTWGPMGKAVYTPLELFDLLGPCPRQCLRFAGKAKTRAGPKVDLRDYYQPSCVCLFFDLDALLRTVRHRAPPPDIYEYDDIESILFLYNARPKNPSRAPAFHYAVPTLFLREVLTDHLRSAWVPRAPPRIAAAVLARAPSLAVAFCQPLLVEYLLETRAGRFCYVPGSDGGDGPVTTFRLGPGLAHPHQAIQLHPGPPLPTNVKDESILVPCAGFTAFDAVVVSEGKTRVTMLRVAVGTLELDAAAIRAAIDMFDRVLPHPETVRWSFVYAALDGDRARNLAESAGTRQMLEGVDPRLRVGWMNVGTLKRMTRALLNAFETGRSEEEIGEERPAKRVKYGSSGSETQPRSKPTGKKRSAAGPMGDGRRERPNTRSQKRTM